MSLAFPNTEINTGTVGMRLPPQNIEAEMCVLGSLMLDKDAVYKVMDALAPFDFYKPVHKEIYEAVLDLLKQRDPVDVLSVTSRLRERGKLEIVGGSAYLTTLVNTVPTASHVAHYASIVRRKRLLRDLIEASSHIAQLGYQESENVDSLIDEAEQKIFEIAKHSLRQEFIPVHEALDEAWERIERLHKGDGALRGVATGFPDLDNYLSGLQRSDLVILAARPSLGKTALALNIAKNVALEGKTVGLFSLEMSREQLVDRLLSSESKVDLWRIRTGKMRSDEYENDFVRIRDSMEALSKAPIYIDDSASPTVMEIRAKARRLMAERDLSLVVIDYLQLIKGHDRAESRVQEVSEISRGLKAMAKELNIPVLALSQLSRGIEMRPSSRPKLSDLRESGCLAGDTLITRADTGEQITIKELIGQKNIPVFALNEKMQIEIRFISKVFSSGYKKLFEIKTSSGRTIKASSNHPFFTLEGWKSVDKLKTSLRVALPRCLKIASPRVSMQDEEIILLAHLLGDGCVLPRQPIHYTSADNENLQAVKTVAQKLFHITPRLVAQKNWFHLYLPSPYNLARNKKHPITNWFKRLRLSAVRSYQKVIPQAIFSLPEEKIRLFLHHLWSTDGNISWKLLPGRKSAAAIYYATTSHSLAWQIQHLLLRLSIVSTVRTVQQKSYRPIFQVHIQGSYYQAQFCKLVGSFGTRGAIIPDLLRALEEIKPNPNNDIIPKEAWMLYINPVRTQAGVSWRDFSGLMGMSYCGSSLFKSGISRQRMERAALALQNQSLLTIAKSNIYWDEIISITPLGIEEVFDATVPGLHNFVANDFIVHNSIEQDADVVMFIYREDKVKENSDRKNMADILIEKHRNGPTGSIELYFHEETASFRSVAKHFEEPV